MAGQGLNLGLEDAQSLAKVLSEAANAGVDLGDPQTLSRYDQDRRLANLRMMGLLDILNRLYGSTPPPISWVRNTGMNAINSLPPLKHLIISAIS